MDYIFMIVSGIEGKLPFTIILFRYK